MKSQNSRRFYSQVHNEWWPLENPELIVKSERFKKALRTLKKYKPQRMLEIGFENPYLALETQRALDIPDYYVVDLSSERIGKAVEVGLRGATCDVTSDPLPFDAGSFDAVYMAEVIEHLYDPDFAIQEIRRVLAPGGHLFLTTPNLASWYNRILLCMGIQPIQTEVSSQRVIGRVFSGLGQGSRPVGHIRVFTRRSLHDFFSLHGWRIVSEEGYSDPRVALDRVFSRVTSLSSGFVIVAETESRESIP